LILTLLLDLSEVSSLLPEMATLPRVAL